MEQALCVSYAGKVTAVHCSLGDVVESDMVLVDVEPSRGGCLRRRLTIPVGSWLQQLYFESQSDQHRRAMILSGSLTWSRARLSEIRRRWSNARPLIIGRQRLGLPDAECIPHHLFRGLLGSEYRLVIVDCTERFDVDVLAAVCGVVCGGGIFVMVVPSWDDEAAWQTSYSEHLSVEGCSTARSHRHFIERFCRLSLGQPGVVVWNETLNRYLPRRPHRRAERLNSHRLNGFRPSTKVKRLTPF